MSILVSFSECCGRTRDSLLGSWLRSDDAFHFFRHVELGLEVANGEAWAEVEARRRDYVMRRVYRFSA